MTPTSPKNVLMEQQVEDSLKRFDAAVRASTSRLVSKDEEGESARQNDRDEEEESLEALASRIVAEDGGAEVPEGKDFFSTVRQAVCGCKSMAFDIQLYQ